jgi:tetratricopeptide (TPR) repeat protein
LAEAHAVLANILVYYDHQQRASESEFRKALELNPNYASAHQWFWHLLGQQRRFDEGFAEIRKAMELDPLSRAINENFAGCLYYAGEFDAAIAQYKKVSQLDPNWADAYRLLFRSYLRKTMYDDALAAVETYGLLSKKPFETMLLNAYVYATKGEREKARGLLAEVERNLRQELISPFQVGLVHFLLGEVDSGFEWLERAFNERDPWIMWLDVEFELEGVRADPRVLSLLERVGLGQGRK